MLSVCSPPARGDTPVRFPVPSPDSGPRSFLRGYPSLWSHVPSGRVPQSCHRSCWGRGILQSCYRFCQEYPNAVTGPTGYRMTGVPPGQDWGTSQPGLGYPLARIPPQAGLGYPLARIVPSQDWGIPLAASGVLIPGTGYAAGSTPCAVSHRRTFLFNNLSSLAKSVFLLFEHNI